jgi:centromere protein C
VRRAASHAVSRRLDFEEDTSLQESPALRGSGQVRVRGKRKHVYDIEQSPSRAISPVLDESFVQEEITAQEEIIANEDSAMNGFAEESFTGDVGDNTAVSATILDDSIDVTDGEIAEQDDTLPELEPEPVVVAKQPLKKGRKRKSEVLESAAEEERVAPKSKKQAAAPKKEKKAAAPAPRRRSNRNSDVEEGPSTTMDDSMDSSELIEEPIEEPVVALKRRGRPPKVQPQREKASPANAAATAKSKSKASAPKKPEASAFKKPELPAAKKPKAAPRPKPKVDSKKSGIQASPLDRDAGKLVDNLGNPLSKADVDQMSVTSTGSRYGRGRQLLSVYRELGPDEVARVGKTGRHRVAPVDFWKNERLAYNYKNDLEAVVRNETLEPERATKSKQKGRKRTLAAVEEEDEDDLEEWEATDGVVIGEFRDFDPVTEVTSADLLEDSRFPLHTGYLWLLTLSQPSVGHTKALILLMCQTPLSNSQNLVLLGKLHF